MDGLPYKNYKNVDTTFWTDYTHNKELMAEVTLTGTALHKEERKYNGKYGHTIGRIQKIFIMSIIGIYYTD